MPPYLGTCFFCNTPRLWRRFSNKLATCYKLHETIGQILGYLSIEDEVFRKQQTDVHFGRIKTIIFFLKSWSNIQMFKSCISLGFRQAIVCLAYVTLRKLRIDQTLLALPEGNVNFGDKVVVSHFNTVLGKFSCGIKVSYR